MCNGADDAPATAYDVHRPAGRKLSAGAAEREVPDLWEGVVVTTRIRAGLGFRPRYPSVWTALDAGAL
ncbi:hypothetical protein ACIQGZ_19895 [Streptomyces sp. NPDC092296]|uniref:hypothetical protein n=1 Tax=Streptomyces sp. NPDC092296 TaxID=3366012 RepID=UPI00382608F4